MLFNWFFYLTFGPAAIGFGVVTLYRMIRYGECWNFDAAYEGQLKPNFFDYAVRAVISLGAIVMGIGFVCLPFR